MAEEEDLELDVAAADAEGTKKKSPMKLIIIIAVVAVVLIGGGVTAALLLMGGDPETPAAQQEDGGGEAAAEAAPEVPKSTLEEFQSNPVIYHSIKDPFTVNFEDDKTIRFLQVHVQVMTRDPLVVEALEMHMPVIRNNLVLLFSGQSYENIITREGKETLRDDALKEIQKVLESHYGGPGVEAVYFTNFVIQ